ncbi:acetyltransferase [Collimonas sp. OK242]|uniref:bifunctional acetate--CoA ligase family protein/GNAT family N-acetyltransferase n=1 Tax=Collimonas sp. OK242 TaxID=1798195 RepID=UPI0008974C07|nr:bifunctional acetate--CoA ligase family protein/GNAT family N-acetyltransferase [Collimonas sp. OK242]SDX40567.1 acetyltransferase [Collimonas sp. OK242]
MSARNLQFFFAPRSIAVIGASEKTQSMGTFVLRHLVQGGFKGSIFPVNPKYALLEGLKTYHDLAELPAAPELAVICTPSSTIPRIVAQLGRLGTKAAIVLSEEAGGGKLQAAVLETARPHLLRILGPGSAGILLPGLGLNASLVAAGALQGRIALLAQSGTLAAGMLDWARSQGIGFSKVIALGDGADVDAGDMLDYLAGDSDTRAILLCIEDIPHARKFMSAARAAARNKPTLILRTGQCGGGLPDAVLDAAIRRAGMLRVFSTEDLFSAVETLSQVRPFGNGRLTIIGNGRGPGLMAGDALLRGGGKPATLSDQTLGKLNQLLPMHAACSAPIALPANASASLYGQVLEEVAADSGADALLAIHAPSASASCVDIANAIMPLARQGAHNILVCWLGGAALEPARRIFADAGIATYGTPEAAVRGFMQMADFRRNQHLLMQVPPTISPDLGADRPAARRIVAAALAGDRLVLAPADAGALLAAYGIAVNDVHPADGAQLAAPVLKIGIVSDPIFGPAIVLGQGGKFDLPAIAAGLPPLNMVLAHDMVMHAVMHAGAAEANDGAPRRLEPEIDGICRNLVKISHLLTDVPELVELEIHFSLPDGKCMVALQAHGRLQPGAVGDGLQRLAICPYPEELEETISWQGETLLLRPIKPEDGQAHIAFFNALDPEDVRYRMFVGMRALQPSQLARFTQIDYDREMAFIATRKQPDGSAETLGVARVVADPDNIQAEFSVIVRSDLKGLGLGQVLMAKLIAYCRRHGTVEIVGEALPHNTRILHLVRKLGFDVKPLERDGTMWLHLDLQPSQQR